MIAPPSTPPTGPPPPLPPMPVPSNPSLMERERRSWKQHQMLSIHGSRFPPPRSAPRGTFIHGFLLPFSLIIATLRHPTLGLSYLRLTVVRALIVTVCAAFAFATPAARRDIAEGNGPKVVVARRDQNGPPKPVHVNAPGVKVDIDEATGEKKAVILGTEIPIVDDAKKPAPKEDEDDVTAKKTRLPKFLARAIDRVTSSWRWLVWFIGVVSATEAFVVFFSRRWDDWVSFYAASIARIRPEDPTPPHPKVALDFRWLVRKFKRRIRGYLVFFAGFPLIALFRIVPGHIDDVKVGNVLFSIALTIWGWYWLAVFTAGKSAHAWIDADTAPSPLLIRELRDRSVGPLFAPVRLYARLWAWITRSMNGAAMTFERNPRAFLGLAIARVILSLPGLYLLARPIVPIASGRLCAESDPADRFSMQG